MSRESIKSTKTKSNISLIVLLGPALFASFS